MLMPNIIPALQALAIPIASLHFDPANARKHNDKNLDAIKASLAKFGQRKPVVVQREGMIVRAGNGTLAAAKALGWDEIAAVILDDDNATASQYAIADNRTAELAEWDNETLASLLDGMDDQDRELLGFNADDMKELLGELTPEITEDDVPEPPPEPITKPGDLWLLGDHRLLCGDSTKADDVARVMGGEQATLCLTDPPYNVGLDYGESFVDQKQDDEYQSWSAAWLNAAMEVSRKVAFTPGGVNVRMWMMLCEPTTVGCWVKSGSTGGAHGAVSQFQCWEPILFVENKSKHHARKYEFTSWLRGTGVTTKQIDDATKSNMGGHYLTTKSQPAIPTPEMWARMRSLFSSVPNEIQQLVGVRIDSGFGRVRHSDVFDYSPADGVVKGHACPKPVALWADLVKHYADPASVVYEPFSGSGTTLIACEQLGRKCYGMEISPHYCDVIVQRWETLTGKKAVLLNG